MERVPSKDIGAGNFVIGDTRIRPRVPTGVAVPVTFHRAQSLNFWMQVYNLGIDEKSKQNGATIDYQILDMATNKAVLQTQELTSKTNPNADQVTIEKSLPLASLAAGKVSGEHQGERRSHEAADRRICAVHRGLGRCDLEGQYGYADVELR